MKTAARLLLLTALLPGCSFFHTYLDSPADQGHYRARESEPRSTIFAHHAECTGCADVLIDRSKIPIPTDLRKYLGDTLATDALLIVGRFPVDLLDNTTFDYSSMNLRLQGKIIRVDSLNAVGKLPVFYVETWEEAAPYVHQ